MPYPKNPVKLKEWCDGLDRDYPLHPDAWHRYDTTIMNTVGDYNIWLKNKAGFPGLDWTLVRAQAWVESGANHAAWNNNVLQIGKKGDTGLNELLINPNARSILPPQYRPFLNAGVAVVDPTQNIRAGVGHLLFRAAYFGLVEVPVPDPDRIPDWLPSTSIAASPWPHPESKTRREFGITGWRPLDFHLMAIRYNFGDGNYYDKLVHASDIAVRGVPQPSSGATK